MNGGRAALAVVVCLLFAVIQSTLLRFIAIAGVQPDLVLIVIVFVAHRNGVMVGQLAGFGAGVILDVMGLSPLGLYALILAVLGAIYGATKGKMFIDPVFMPVLLLIVALLIKALLGLILGSAFAITGLSDRILSVSYLIEIGYTAVVAPVVFGLLRLIRPMNTDRRGAGL